MKTLLLTITLATLVSLPLSARAEEFEFAQNDFKSLYNKVRTGQPKVTPWPSAYWPYEYYGTAANVESGRYTRSKTRGESPLTIFDKLAGQSGKNSAVTWEEANHNCDDQTDPEMKRGCISWWGHCNGWSAAAVKEDEPKNDFQIDGVPITTSTAKGIFAEVWLSSNSLFAGETDKEEKTAKGLSTWMTKPNDETYQTFWDVTPKTWFLIATNYMGIAKMGFVIDRFTGDEVWNQPVVGYRLLPLEADKIRVEARGGKQLWAVPIRMKIYWGNDLDIPPGVIAKGFDINKDSDDTGVIEHSLPTAVGGELAYEARLLEFTLFFDKEVKVSPDGLKVLQAGRIVGDGIWKMQENPSAYSASQLNDGHPDFVWMPTNWNLDTEGDYGNPHLDRETVAMFQKANAKANRVSAVQAGAAEEKDVPDAKKPRSRTKELTTATIRFAKESFEGLKDINADSVRRRLRRLFARAGIRVSMPAESVAIGPNGAVTVTPAFPEGTTRTDLSSLFDDSAVAATIQ